MQDITYKKVYGKKGEFETLEIWQGDSFISISLGSTALETQRASYKWGNIKETVDAFAEEVKEAASKDMDSFTKSAVEAWSK